MIAAMTDLDEEHPCPWVERRPALAVEPVSECLCDFQRVGRSRTSKIADVVPLEERHTTTVDAAIGPARTVAPSPKADPQTGKVNTHGLAVHAKDLASGQEKVSSDSGEQCLRMLHRRGRPDAKSCDSAYSA